MGDNEQIKNINPDDKVKLKRKLGLWGACSTIIGTSVGTGIFIAPKGILAGAGSVGVSLIIWTVGGVMALLGALSYIELGTRYPKAGGEYAYISALFGDMAAFLYVFNAAVFFLPPACGTVALGFGHYVTKPFFPGCEAPNIAVVLCAISAIGLLTFLNCASVTKAILLQKVLSVVKLLSPFVIAVTGIAVLSTGRTEKLENAFEETNPNTREVILSLYFCIYTYSGWSVANMLIEEIRNPYRNLPLCIIISVPTIILIYITTNVAYFTVLTKTQILQSNAVAVTFAEEIMGPMSWLVPIMIISSCFGSVNSNLMQPSRLYYAGSRAGHLPSMLSLINIKTFTPITAVMFFGIMMAVSISFFDVYSMIIYCTFIDVVVKTLPVIGIIYRRLKYPKEQIPIKIPLIIHILFVASSVFLMVITLIESPIASVIGIALLISGTPIYLFIIKPKRDMRKYNIVGKLYTLAQKLTVSMPEDTDKG